MKDAFSCFCYFCIACMFSFSFFCCGRDAAREQMQEHAVERGFAEYDAKTGEWKWKEPQVAK